MYVWSVSDRYCMSHSFAYLKHEHLPPEDGKRVEAAVTDVWLSVGVRWFVAGRYSGWTRLPVVFAWIYGRVRADGWDCG